MLNIECESVWMENARTQDIHVLAMVAYCHRRKAQRVLLLMFLTCCERVQRNPYLYRC